MIAVLAPRGGFWTPNGRHRLEAMRRLGAKSVTALVIPECEIAWQILALNTEKAHNLKERSLEVIRIYHGLVDEDGSRPESGFAFYLDQAALVTMGVCYERVSRFGGGAYHPILRRLEDFSDDSLRSALKQHEKRAVLKDRWPWFRPAAHNRTQPSKENLERKRLGQIIVRTEIQTLYDVGRSIASREHQYWGLIVIVS